MFEYLHQDRYQKSTGPNGNLPGDVDGFGIRTQISSNPNHADAGAVRCRRSLRPVLRGSMLSAAENAIQGSAIGVGHFDRNGCERSVATPPYRPFFGRDAPGDWVFDLGAPPVAFGENSHWPSAAIQRW